MIVAEALEKEQIAERSEPPQADLFITTGGLALTAPEVTFIQTHQRPVVKAMKPYLIAADLALDLGQPVNTVLPLVTGTGTVGQTLSCSTGTWLNTPTFTYQWYRSGVLIAAATAATYLLVAGDSTKAVSCVVTGTKAGLAVAAPSSNSIAVT